MTRTNKYTERRRKGIVTPYGQWLYPGKVTTIPGNNITMQGVPYPVLGVSDKGDTKMMMPGMDYLFKGNEVTEYPVVEKEQLGNWLKETARKLFNSEARNAPSYKKDKISFSNAFNDARSKGYNTFYWDGKYYNTVKKEELDENNQLKKDVYFPSYDIKEYIKNTESFRPNVYVDGKGVETIGYGFTDKDIIEKYRDTGMTREMADTIFNDYINSFVGELRNTPHFEDLNQNQRDSLLSYMYNIGATNYFNNSPLMQEALQNKNWAEAAKQMDYGYNDLENPGLRKRRDYERKLFLTPVKQEGGDLLAYNEPSYFLAGQQMNKNKPYTASTSGIYASKWPTRDAAISNGVENGSSQQAFFEDLFNAMAGYMKNNGIDESVGRPVAYDIVAHHAMESSSGGRLPASFNYGGVRIPGSEDYKSFNDMNDYAKYYFENTVGGRNVLEQAMKGNAMSLEDYMRMLKDNGYFEADLGTYTANTRKDGYARAQKYLDDISYQTGGKIHIKEKNRGKFTEAAQRAGKSVQAYAAQILANKENYSPTLIKRANFARNSAKWKHQEGGDVIKKYLEGNYLQPKTVDSVMGAWNDQLAKGFAKGDMIANHVGNALNAVATTASAIGAKFGGKGDGNVNVNTNFKQLNEADDFGEKVQTNTNAAPLYWQTQQNNPQPQPFGGYWGMQTLGQGDNTMQPVSYKFATGGLFSTPAEIERGEIVSTPTGDSIANGLMDYHELFSNRNEKEKNIVNLTNNLHKDVQRNPQLSPITERVNKYTSMRRNGKTFIFPSTVGRNGEILEPKNGNFYWLAKTINKK